MIVWQSIWSAKSVWLKDKNGGIPKVLRMDQFPLNASFHITFLVRGLLRDLAHFYLDINTVECISSLKAQ